MWANDAITLYYDLIKPNGVVLKTTDIFLDEDNYPVELNVFPD